MSLGGVRRTGKLSKVERQELLKGILFISPWLIGFLVFHLYPLAASFYYSFTIFDILRPPLWVGFANYVELARDAFFHNSLYNTLFYAIFAVPGGVLVGFVLAALLNLNLRFRSGLRAIFFLPSIVPQFISAMVWLWIYNQQYGLLNLMIKEMGFGSIPWLSDPSLAKPALILISLWGCGTTMVIFLAALQDVPRELYEAAQLDGAAPQHELWHVTIPLVTPAVLFNLLMGFIGAFQYFTFAWIMTRGGPVRSTEFLGMYLYKNAFLAFRMGFASAMAWIMFLMTILVTIAIFRTSARWVYYGGER